MPEYFFKRGEECLIKGDLHWALESFNRAIELDSELEMAYLRRAETLRKLGQEKDAVGDLIKFIEYDKRGPDNPEDLDDAIREAFKIAKMDMQRNGVKNEILDYGIPRLLNEMMESFDPQAKYEDRKFYDLALKWLKKHPECGNCYEGYIKLIKGDINTAIKKFEEAINENPKDPYPYYFTGIALLRKSITKRRFLSKQSKDAVSVNAKIMFDSALRHGLEGKVCPSCGYRELSIANFCLRCGDKLLIV